MSSTRFGDIGHPYPICRFRGAKARAGSDGGRMRIASWMVTKPLVPMTLALTDATGSAADIARVWLKRAA